MSTEILAPMPGSIWKVHVKEGDEVVEGQELLILEAMKMENPIITTTAGKVTEVKVKVEDKVATKQLLLTIE
ncbi:MULTISPECIES: acetyl-CoA carboxylase biotin carboxyl carrier protein subunit [Desulfobacula]|uniref:Methylmalonyl-CoA carboxyltransferase 1.3S subunit n=2 Tax=Desulfobacula TaxID=28222 RepID=A0A1H2IGL5_9BACT|nr:MULTISPECIES: acetyl-CoA carboxylase biotin carboxyl carrier protein subunit [Desulfobacula]CCK81980.1 putative biotin/lipoyl attachment protein [Desulfobacula toluolica Tol2]SDU43277.1 methylmalonyl-CoA carboxyltransferase 1.3S subunit [Desulfobacula phenolica]